MLMQLGVFLLPAVPLLVLVAFLLLGRFPGEEAIERLSRAVVAAKRRVLRRDRGPRPAAPADSWAPGGGLLIAFGLARRPPPASP